MRHSVVVLDSTAAVEAVDARVDALDSDGVANESAVTGADVTAALNAVKTALGLCRSSRTDTRRCFTVRLLTA